MPGSKKLLPTDLSLEQLKKLVVVKEKMDKLTVRKCDVVKRGQVIGSAGATGNATKPQLHFELRKGSKPVDPQTYFSRS